MAGETGKIEFIQEIIELYKVWVKKQSEECVSVSANKNILVFDNDPAILDTLRETCVSWFMR